MLRLLQNLSDQPLLSIQVPYLLELVLVLPGLSDAGNGFSVLISSAFNIDEVDTLDRY